MGGIKMEKSLMGLKGFVKLEKVSGGKVVDTREFNNLIVNAGKAQVAALILSDIGGTAFDYLGVGTGSTAPNATDTALVSQAYRTTGTGVRITTSVANDTARLSSSFAITTSATLREIGIFNSASTGIMLGRATFSDLAVNNEDTVNATYSIQVS
jgi:hypothetical protein